MTQLSTALHLALTDLVGRERLEDETGAQTAEYGILTLAAVGFAGVLAVLLTSPEVQEMLKDIIAEALKRD
ncbi:DUF4244 domain-containing protein [Micrococcus sp. 2A]|uniref:DUF4244 domain-containing protein n=1 Tax=Actinomycetes TaxID=1760 RepID=UPI00110F906A|nr:MULTISPECIES: DUF4244 domain-containing protein [Actinomycetes]MCK6096128.1 DUF4244 domain-containing protein [Micrococcus sp. EYE_212]MCK6172219.1 DUF4244 domain-containing protein [Micrococcus sp. EYE_162]